MTYVGTVINGAIVLDGDQQLPEGARVEVAVAAETNEKSEQADTPRTAKELLRMFAGCMTDLPTDLARNHDRYLHGAPTI